MSSFQLSKITKYNKTWAKVLWIIFLWMIFCGLVIHLSSVIRTYADFTYTQNVKFENSHFFPDITFCPLGSVYPDNLYDPNSTDDKNEFWNVIENKDIFKYLEQNYMKYNNSDSYVKEMLQNFLI